MINFLFQYENRPTRKMVRNVVVLLANVIDTMAVKNLLRATDNDNNKRIMLKFYENRNKNRNERNGKQSFAKKEQKVSNNAFQPGIIGLHRAELGLEFKIKLIIFFLQTQKAFFSLHFTFI